MVEKALGVRDGMGAHTHTNTCTVHTHTHTHTQTHVQCTHTHTHMHTHTRTHKRAVPGHRYTLDVQGMKGTRPLAGRSSIQSSTLLMCVRVLCVCVCLSQVEGDDVLYVGDHIYTDAGMWPCGRLCTPHRGCLSLCARCSAYATLRLCIVCPVYTQRWLRSTLGGAQPSLSGKRVIRL